MSNLHMEVDLERGGESLGEKEISLGSEEKTWGSTPALSVCVLGVQKKNESRRLPRKKPVIKAEWASESKTLQKKTKRKVHITNK